MGAALAAALFLLAPLQSTAAQDPAAVVRQAIAAVEGDSAGPVERRWTRALARRTGDRLAALGLATLAHATYRDSIAHQHYRVALSGSTRDRTAGYAALGTGLLLDEREEWSRADSIIVQAILSGRAVGDTILLAEALIAQARVKFSLSQFDTGQASLAEATSILRPIDYRLLALARCTAGRGSAAQGDHRGALRHFVAGSDLAERGKETRIRAWCDFGAGSEYNILFHADSVLLAFERAIAGFRQTRNAWGLAAVLNTRGEHLHLYGALGQAIRDAEEAVVQGEASRHFGYAAWSRLTLARIAHSLDDLPQAVAQLEEARRFFAVTQDERGLAMAPTLHATLALARGDAGAARPAFEEAVAHSRTGARFGAVAAFTGLAWTALMASDSSAARLAVDSALTLLVAAGMPAHPNPLSLLDGTIALRFGRLADAERIFRARLAGQNPGQGSRYYVTAARLSETLVRQGRLDEAETLLRTAAVQFDSWRQSVDEKQLRQLAYQLAADLSDPDLGVATVIAELARAGRTASAFELVERGRARNLADRLNRAAALDTTAKRAARVGAVVTLDSVMRALPDESTAILEYVAGRGDPTTLFVITRRQARAHVLAPEDSLGPSIARLTRLLESGEEPWTLARELSDQVLAPALAELDTGVTRLIVVPDGSLNRLPFDVLVLPDSRFVLERFTVATAPAASIAAHLWARAPAASPGKVAVLADPRFAGETQNESSAELFRSAVSEGKGLPRLRGSGREARTVARYAGDVTVLRRRRASEAWIKSAPLEQYAVMHFATHALVDEGSVRNTALALAPAGSDDGFIHPAELADLSLAAELVVLSACRTAGGTIVRGEGIQGLAAPLLAAGARAVAATWWPIGDLATLKVVDDFYREMAAGQPAGDALRASKLAALKRGAPPRDWAAFTLVGDPLARPPLRQPGPASPGWRTLLVAMLTLTVAYLAMRRRRVRDSRLPSGSAATTHHT